MKRALLAFLVALTPAPALAFDLGQALDGLASLTCRASGSVGGFAVPINGLGDLQGFCRAYEVYKRSQNFGAFLADAGRLALQNFARGVIDAAVAGIGAHTSPILSRVSGFLDGVAHAANEFLNLPYLAAAEVYGLVYGQVYRGVYDQLRQSVSTPSIALAPPTQATAVTDPELQRAYGYMTQAEVQRLNQDLARAAQAVEGLAEAAAETAETSRAMLEAEERAEKAAEEVREAAVRESVRQALAGQNEVAQKLAEAASQVTASGPTGKGKAEQYREEAANAPSDRALLELQVRALADIMEQQAIYMPYIAELLVQQARTQAMTTLELRQAVLEAAKRQEEAMPPTFTPEAFEGYLRQAELRAKADTDAMRRLLNLACGFYGGGQECVQGL